MVYLCKSYNINNGQVDQYILFNSIAQSMNWATKHARVVVATRDGWDTTYHVTIYDVPFELPFDPINPGNIIRVIKP